MSVLLRGLIATRYPLSSIILSLILTNLVLAGPETDHVPAPQVHEVAPGWSVFGEYNYMDFGHRNLAFAASPGFVVTDTLSSHLTVQEALVGVNYKFNWGWGGAPVAARY